MIGKGTNVIWEHILKLFTMNKLEIMGASPSLLAGTQAGCGGYILVAIQDSCTLFLVTASYCIRNRLEITRNLVRLKYIEN